jgi:nitrite reductase/ring-hydroxylating ferredoxin subunit
LTGGGALKVETEGLEVAVFNVEGVFYVTDDTCTHGPGSLSEGYLEGHRIECDFHNGAFDVRTGEVVAPPCMIPDQDLQGQRRGRRRLHRSLMRQPSATSTTPPVARKAAPTVNLSGAASVFRSTTAMNIEMKISSDAIITTREISLY